MSPQSADGARLWVDDLDAWTWWNGVRGAAPLLAAAAFTAALAR